MKYYQYSHDPMGNKYTEMSGIEFFKVRNTPDRWFINFGNCIIECEKSEYTAYYRMIDHYSNTRKNAAGKWAELCSLDLVPESCCYDSSVFAVQHEYSPEDKVIARLYQAYCKQRILAALETLRSDEVYLIYEIALKSRKQVDLAAELGISHQAVSKKYLSALTKLKRLLRDLER